MSQDHSTATRVGAPDLRLRAHRPGDIGWVIQRHGELYHAEFGWDARFDGLVAGICARFIESFDPLCERCWIAEDSTGRLGCVFLVKVDDNTAKLRMLLVEPRARGMHLGTLLVDECIAFARAAGYTTLALWTNQNLHAARSIYVKRGFKLVGSEAHASFGHNLVGEFWELALQPVQLAASA
jgi:GNAT superfamily N-acetyltransferase